MDSRNHSKLIGLIAAGVVAVLPAVTSAQTATDLDCANCVDRSDLAAKSVTAAKIGNSAVTTDKLSASAVTTNKIANTAVSRSKIRAGAVSTGKLANGAVTADKIAAGAITSDKLTPDAVFSRILIVRADGTPTENCDALRSALGSIFDNSQSTPYVVKLEPGQYACGTTSLDMKPWVDLEGSGEILTRVSGAVETGFSGVVAGASNSELRDMTVHNTGTGAGNDAYAVRAFNRDNFRISRVTAIADGSSFFTRGIVILDGNATVRDSTAVANGSGISDGITVSFGADVEIMDSVAEGTTRGLLIAQASTVMVRNTTLTAGTFAASVIQSSVARIASSELSNGVEVDTATLTCVHSYDAAYESLAANCTN